MSMRWQIEPMARWPYPDTSGRRKSNPFRAKFDDTLRLLEDELDHLGVTGAVAVRVVASEADVRLDGHAPRPRPGPAPGRRHLVSRYYGESDWHANLRAIALGLETLRRLDRRVS